MTFKLTGVIKMVLPGDSQQKYPEYTVVAAEVLLQCDPLIFLFCNSL